MKVAYQGEPGAYSEQAARFTTWNIFFDLTQCNLKGGSIKGAPKNTFTIL